MDVEGEFHGMGESGTGGRYAAGHPAAVQRTYLPTYLKVPGG